MKIFSTPSILGFASLFCTFTSATITIEDIPPVVRVGERYDVTWSSDHDCHIKYFHVMHWDESEGSEKPVGGIVEHYKKMSAGQATSRWMVPSVKNGVYDLFISAVEVDEQGELILNATVYANSNKFEITGGPTLYPKEVAGVVVGTVAAIALLIGAWIVGARLWRKRRSLAVNLSNDNERGYTDSTTGAR